MPRLAPLLLIVSQTVAATTADERAKPEVRASRHGMTPPVWRALCRGAMSLAGLAAIREFPVPPNHKSGTAAMHS
jgi:hypothetical protein